MLAGLDFLHEVAGRFVHVREQFEFDIGDVAVLAVVVLFSEFGFIGAPAAQGFEGDFEFRFDEVEVAVVLVEEIEGLDFGIEVVFCWHGGGPFCLCAGSIIAQTF